MALDTEFRRLLEYELEKTLDVMDKDSEFSTIWGCKSSEDFLYGWHMAKADDFCTNQYFAKYHKNPDKDDRKEIQGILFLHAKDFRDRLQNR